MMDEWHGIFPPPPRTTSAIPRHLNQIIDGPAIDVLRRAIMPIGEAEIDSISDNGKQEVLLPAFNEIDLRPDAEDCVDLRGASQVAKCKRLAIGNTCLEITLRPQP